ncbi:MAG: DUF4956 domain-containing protein [Verrucomicrobiae bacterium]|nr:DUF4956 domain-containing protein [Verrucomicrobiae bacterium]
MNRSAMSMRRFCLLAFTFAIWAVSLRAGAVPAVVEKAFSEKYPGATVEDWEVDVNGYWEADFELRGIDHRADFMEDGTWVETERNINFNELPDEVQRAVKLDFGNDEISEIEVVDHPRKGLFYDVEFKRPGKNLDIEYKEDGTRAESLIDELNEPVGSIAAVSKRPEEMGKIELAIEFGFNTLTIFLYAWVIYYRRHHDHKMMFLLLGFNLFLFPIFLLSSSLTAGFGFTIFALLALVRMRSDTFSKTEIAYLLGAVALTFINAILPARVEYISSVIVLVTAYLGDHPRIWRDAYHTVAIRYRTKDVGTMLNQEHLRARISEDFKVEVNDIDIERIDKNEVRLVVLYRDLPDVRKARREEAKKRLRRFRRRRQMAEEEQAKNGEPASNSSDATEPGPAGGGSTTQG